MTRTPRFFLPAASADPWGPGGAPSNGTVSKGLDDEFDMLSSRSKSPQTAATGGLGMLDMDLPGLSQLTAAPPQQQATTEPEMEDLFGLGAAAAALSGGQGVLSD